MNNQMKAALELVRRGWYVFPTHSTDKGGNCSCGKLICEHKGKHPRTPSGLKDASADESIVCDWWDRWPDANIAVRTGAESGIFALDIDVKKGAKGDESITKLEEEHVGLPETLTARTWSGGSHKLFNHPGGILKNRTGFRPGLDIRGDNGYIIVAPSTICGNEYEWCNPNTPVADAPDWLLETITQSSKGSYPDSFCAHQTLQGISEGQRNDGIFRLASSLRGKDLPYEQAKLVILEAASNCSPCLHEQEAIKCLDSAYGRYEPGGRRKLTDLGNAERMTDRYGEHLRFVPELNTWIYWNSNWWEFDGLGRINQLAKTVIRGIYAEASRESDEGVREAISKHARSSERRSAIESMIQLTKAEVDIPIHAGILDSDPWLFGVANGVIDLKSGELRPANPSDYITKQADVEYRAGVSCPIWEKFLLEIMGGCTELVTFLQRAIGYTLTGITNEQAAFILHGTGANGKSTFLDIVETLMGSYATSVASETLMMQRGGRNASGPNEDIARLKGARLAVTSETEEGQILAEALLKRMTGEDTLVARVPYAKQSMEFKPNFKVWMGANYRPIIRGDDHAIWRRINLIPFDQTFAGKAQDKKLKHKLLAELPGILNWAIAGCLTWQKDGLNPPRSILEATREYRTEMDLLAEWLESTCVTAPGESATVASLYNSYRLWCLSNHVDAMNNRIFGRKLKSKGFESLKIEGQRGYRGIGIKKSERVRPIAMWGG